MGEPCVRSCQGRGVAAVASLTVLAFNSRDSGNVASAEGESGPRKQEERKKAQKEGVWLDGSHVDRSGLRSCWWRSVRGSTKSNSFSIISIDRESSHRGDTRKIDTIAKRRGGINT
jgi:hypothetical protein